MTHPPHIHHVHPGDSRIKSNPYRHVLLATAFLALLCAAMRPAGAAGDVSALLREKTQAFSDAGQQGNAVVMKNLLADDVVFFNENGDQASKSDMVAGATPTPGNARVKMTITDWHCQIHGGVAVASFIDDQVRDLHGQIFHAQYRSVETWLKEAGTWRIIGSQTLALQSDPPAVTLSAQTLDAYVGTYEAGPDLKVVFLRNGGDLTASTNGGPASVQRAEVKDVFFTPGLPRIRKIFQRDANGSVTGFVSRREGHDISFKRVAAGTDSQVDQKPV